MTITDLHPMLALPTDMSHENIFGVEGLAGYLGTLCGFNSTYFSFTEAASQNIGNFVNDTLGKIHFRNIGARVSNKINTTTNETMQRITQKFM